VSKFYGRKKIPFEQSIDTPDSPIMFPVGVRKVSWIGRNGEANDIESHRALVRLNKTGDSARVMAVVTDSYKLVHNRELFEQVNEAITEVVPAHHLVHAYCVDEVAHGGRSCIRQYLFPSLRCKLRDSVAEVMFRLIMQNGYGGSALRGHGGAIDGFCTNGMISGDFETIYRRHTRGLVIENATAMVRSALSNYVSVSKVWEEWAERHAERSATMEAFRAFANSETLYEKLVDQWLNERETRGNTVWAAYSTLTHYASHVEEGEFAMRGGDIDNASATRLSRELAVAKFVASPAWERVLA
jgi:hypothetical protein